MPVDYVVNLEHFYGPLDLLLYLVEKNEMNIYDIPIAIITDQYMHFVTGSGHMELDQIGEFLMMASYLLSLKARMLLPGKPETTEDEEADPREELVSRLIAYKRYKKAAEWLALRLDENYPRPFFRHGQLDMIEPAKEIVASVQTLLRVYLRLQEDELETAGYCVPQGDINVDAKMEEIMQCLQKVKQTSFHNMFVGYQQRREILAGFLAILELIRLNRIEAVQESRFGDILLRLQESAPC